MGQSKSRCSHEMRSLVILLSVLALVQSSAPAVKDPVLDDYIMKILLNLKELMPVGIPDLGIPVLDPFDVPHFDIPHIDEGIIKLDVEIDDFVITHLSTFEPRSVHMDVEGLALQLELAIPDLRADATYMLYGTIAGLLPLFGDGPMFLELWDLVLKAEAAIKINEQGYVEVTTMDITAEFDHLKIHLDNLVGGGDFGEVINDALNIMGGFIWGEVDDFVFDAVDDALIKVLNDALKGCNIW